MSKSLNRYWFALYTKPRHEFKAEQQLSSLQIETYLPKIERIKQWSDRKKKVIEPLLKSYIFIFANEDERLNAVEQPAVVKCIFDQKKPARIPEWQINNVKLMLANNAEFFVLEGLVIGEKVEIISGPFAGVTGVIQSAKSGKTIVVSLELLNRSIIAHLPVSSVLRLRK